MRSLPEDDYDRTKLTRLNAPTWMEELLALNPAYPHWGPGEDYMSTTGDGWGEAREIDGWSTFGPWSLDDLNECVNYYFEIDRASETCTACGASGYNPETRIIADTFYDHGDYHIDFKAWKIQGDIEAARRPAGATGRKWCDKITQDEVDTLVAAGRLGGKPRTAAEVNEANSDRRHSLAARTLHLDHDAINRGILIETRAKRLGVWGKCPACDGHGAVFTAPAAHLNLVVWMIHPRKGASRGVRVKGLSYEDAQAAKVWLATAAKRNADRFAKVL